jgi:hypothetical protein
MREVCCVCDHIIKDMKDPKKTLQDTLASQYPPFGRWICGSCRSNIGD